MDLTKLPQELIFSHKTSIDDYDIDNDSSADGILYEGLHKMSFTMPQGWDKEKLFLAMFNDANYLSTIILLDKRFSLHTHSWINYYDNQWEDDLIVSVIMYMVDFYISNTIDLPDHARTGVKTLMDDYDRVTESRGFKDIVFEYYIYNSIPNPQLSCDHFKILDIGTRLLKYSTFKGDVNWAAITNNFEINDIIQVTKALGKDVKGQRDVLNDISRSFNSSENKQSNYELCELIGILKSHINDEGVLLSKTKLIEEYEKEQEFHDEMFKQSMNEMAINNFDDEKRKYEKQIAELKAEINKLAAENAAIKEDIKEEPESAFNSNGNNCFTNKQMGIFLRAIAEITEDPVPAKTTLGEIVEKIAGYKATTVNQNMKGSISERDKLIVADAIESKFPKLAARVRKL